MIATRTFLKTLGVAVVIIAGFFVSTSRFDLVVNGQKLVGDYSKAASPAPAQGYGQDAMDLATLNLFESIDIVRRFRARGAATCMESAKEVLSKQSGKFKLQFGTIAGWGNVVQQLLTVQTLSLYSGRPLELLKSTDFESLNFSRWFQIPLPRSDSFLKHAKRADNMKDPMQPINCTDVHLTNEKLGKDAMQQTADVNSTNAKRADNMKDLMQLISSADADQVLNGLDWNVVEPVLALDLPNPLWKEDKAYARHCMARALFDRVSVKLSNLLLAPLRSMLPTDALIGLHLRFGDKTLMEKTGHKGEWAWISDERITATDVPRIWAAIDNVIVALEQRDGIRARLFIASDNVDVLKDARARYGDVLLPEVSHAPPMHVYVLPPRQCDHENWQRQGSTEAYLQGSDKLAAEWFLLALSDVVVQGASSTFSDSAMLLGMQHLRLTCNHGECPTMPKNSLRALFDSLPSASTTSQRTLPGSSQNHEPS